MIFLETDLAIYKRLTGYPLDAKGRPQLDEKGVPKNREVIGPPGMLPYDKIYDATTGKFTPVDNRLPSYGLRIPVMRPNVQAVRGLTSDDPAAVRAFSDGFQENAFRQIPVFDENIEGRKWEDVFPCVTFRWVSTEFDPSTYVYFDPMGYPGSLSEQDPTTKSVNILNQNGEIVQSGYEQNIRRPLAEPWNAVYAITVHSKNSIELKMICDALMRLFPARGSIEVELQDGTRATRDMLYQRTDNLDEGQDRILATLGPEEERAFARSFVYVIETYIDNSTNQFGIQGSPLASRHYAAILARLFEIDDIVGKAVETPETDFNLLETEPIPSS